MANGQKASSSTHFWPFFHFFTIFPPFPGGAQIHVSVIFLHFRPEARNTSLPAQRDLNGRSAWTQEYTLGYSQYGSKHLQCKYGECCRSVGRPLHTHPFRQVSPSDSIDLDQEWTNHRIAKSGRFANFVREPGFNLNSPTSSREKPINLFVLDALF